MKSFRGVWDYINDLVQNCSISIANMLEILQPCTKPSMYDLEESFAQIHLPGWQFYLPQAIGQWDMSSPDGKAVEKWPQLMTFSCKEFNVNISRWNNGGWVK